MLNLETTIAVTQNFVNTSNFEYVCLDMTPGYRHKGVCRVGLLAVKDSGSVDAKNDASPDTNLMNYPDMTRKEKRIRISESDKAPCIYNGNLNGINGLSEFCNPLQSEGFSYDIDFLAKFLEKDRDHYTSTWSPSNCMGPREMRQWLHRLWGVKPTIRQLIWKVTVACFSSLNFGYRIYNTSSQFSSYNIKILYGLLGLVFWIFMMDSDPHILLLYIWHTCAGCFHSFKCG